MKQPLNETQLKRCQEYKEGMSLMNAEWNMLGCFIAPEEETMSKTKVKKEKRKTLRAILG